jgi:hypothetical protein
MFPQAQSVFMDDTAVAAWRHLAVAGTGRSPDVPPHLTQSEKRAFLLCAEHNLRIEQERIPQAAVIAAISKPATMANIMAEHTPTQSSDPVERLSQPLESG